MVGSEEGSEVPETNHNSDFALLVFCPPGILGTIFDAEEAGEGLVHQ